MTTTRRQLLCAALAAPLAACGQQPSKTLVEVWKSPTCGCCKDWMAPLDANGFAVTAHDIGNTAMRAHLGIPAELGSCHTARVAGYAIEGHVPAADIQRLLRDKPQDVIGLAAPGMPIGSPGMDGAAYGGRRDRYQVLLVRTDGSHTVFATHNA